MKKYPLIILWILLAVMLVSCAQPPQADIAATTLCVYDFTVMLCQGTELTVTRLVTEEVSCLHDYTLNVRQVKAAEAAQVIVISGAGLESFLDGVLTEDKLLDASEGISLICPEEEHHHEHDHGHSHTESDPHIWLDPGNAMVMAKNICQGLCLRYPQYSPVFQNNLEQLLQKLEALRNYGQQQLQDLSCRELVTFHDGFSYMAQGFDLTILEAVEEESGSEASARELIHLIGIVEEHDLPAIFTEKNGSTSAAGIISRETGAQIFCLDMAMSGDSYFHSMYANIDTLKEALQ